MEPVPVVAKESKEVTLAVQQAEVTARNSAIELSKVTEQKQTSDNDNKVLEALRVSLQLCSFILWFRRVKEFFKRTTTSLKLTSPSSKPKSTAVTVC